VKVFLVTSDLFINAGGGQTVLRKVIASNPDVHFTYLRNNEPEDSQKPQNTRSAPLPSRRALRLDTPPPYPVYEKTALEEADTIARSVAGESFDIVEMQDYNTFGSALRAACSHHGVKVGRFVLALHGSISTSIELQWGSPGDNVLEQRILEHKQFVEADAVYGISTAYIREWQQRWAREVYFVDPIRFVTSDQPSKNWTGQGLPSLYCIGRSERRKGNDLFIELVRWLRPESYASASHIGPSVRLPNGVNSEHHLAHFSQRRRMDIPYLPSRDQQALLALYKTPSLVIIPTRYDSLNLVALEALFSGCPIAVSERAGVCEYLEQFHPNIPFTKIDFNNFYGSVPRVQLALDDYDLARQTLHQALSDYPPVSSSSLDVMDVYQKALDKSPSSDSKSILVPACQPGAALAQEFKDNTLMAPKRANASFAYEEDTLSPLRRAAYLARHFMPEKLKEKIRPIFHVPKEFFVTRLRDSGYFGDARYFATLLDARWLPSRLRDVAAKPERNQDALKEKLGTLYFYSGLSPLYRCNFWRDIARVERLRGNELMAAAYELRILRLLGRDPDGIVEGLVASLRGLGFVAEADGVEALYGDPAQAQRRVFDLLKERSVQLRNFKVKPWETMQDHRFGKPKVSVIVSLFKAADKLPLFLSALMQQTLSQKGKVEIILVDSGSPTNERQVFDEFQREHKLNILFARSSERETIQAAWNRGISMARAPYLVFLGVDEAIYPETLELLAEELDRKPGIDWVMANSVVTAVDEHGLHKNDIMTYDRSGATKDHTYLDTCFVSWVGGMYRRSIHDRFGYYDETFRGAGDTEFKNRIFPHIEVGFLDQMLGVFLNYPEGQTTASPMAEIEDSRAWYLFRSAGGVRYGFEDRSQHQVEDLLKLCLGYRKSYSGHISTDLDFGLLLAEHLIQRGASSELAKGLAPGLRDMVGNLRLFELAPRSPSKVHSFSLARHAWGSFKASEASHRSMLGDESVAACHYNVFNDNRYEQHSWLWKSIP
jgi:glycosyltransferase involved in cell wall biosynthesis